MTPRQSKPSRARRRTGRALQFQPETQLLRLAATIEADEDRIQAIALAAESVKNWNLLVNRAETHGVAPLLLWHLNVSGYAIPDEERRKLQALTIRHRNANHVRTEVMFDLLRGFESEEIECAVLKGGALAHLIYPQATYRPMRDLDVLVHENRIADARAVAERAGFAFEEQAPSRYMKHHHHIPNATLRRDELLMSLEIHRDALSGDTGDHLQLGESVNPLQTVETEFGAFQCLNDDDMLYHLCLHALEPGTETRLISVADIEGYAKTFFQRINWDALSRSRPLITNTLTLFHYLTPLPDELDRFRPDAGIKAPEGIGRGMKPLSQILHRRKKLSQLWQEIFYPSDWWLHCRYVASPERSITRVRWGRHLAGIIHALARRLISRLSPGETSTGL